MTKEKYGELLAMSNLTSDDLRAFYKAYKHTWGNRTAKRAIARHPNTPPDILMELFFQHPDSILENPALPFLLMEEPNFFRNQGQWINHSYYAHTKILAKPSLPAYVVQHLIRSDRHDVRVMAEHHIALGEAELGWEKHVKQDIALLLCRHKDRGILERCQIVPDWLQELLPSIFIQPSDSQQMDRLGHFPLAQLIAIFRDEQHPFTYRWEVGRNILSRTDAPIELLHEALKFSYNILDTPLARFVVLSQITPTFPPNLLKNKYSLWWVRFAIAINPATEEHILEELTHDVDRYVRAAARERLADSNWRFES
jgi:hypothetical protein